MKASDVFREADFLFAKKGTFDEAFPDIEDFTIEVTEDVHDMIGRGKRRHVYLRWAKYLVSTNRKSGTFRRSSDRFLSLG